MSIHDSSADQLFQGLEQTVQAWARSLEVGGREPEGHTYRVAELALRLAQKIGLPHAELLNVVRGALLHDVGKLGVPESILQKPGKLEPAERAVMEQHPNIARLILEPVEILRPAIDIPYCHHERWNGKGYPQGLAGEQIPLSARLFAVVDVWDALAIEQPYRSAWPQAEIVDHIVSSAGTHFDPDVVDQFLIVIETYEPSAAAAVEPSHSIAHSLF